MKIAIVNGPNLNLLGIREPEIYGTQTMDSVIENLKNNFPQLSFEFFQSNHEGNIIDFLQNTPYDALIINPAAYSHYSYAIADCLKNIRKKKIEVHISNIHSREAFREKSVTAPHVDGVITGLGTLGYHLATIALLEPTYTSLMSPKV